MRVLPKILGFDWDKGNLDKSYEKHGIFVSETEEVFVDPKAIVLPDVRHSQSEARFIIVGRNFGGKNLHVVLTVRKNRIRVISARKMHEKEVANYEKIKKNTTF